MTSLNFIISLHLLCFSLCFLLLVDAQQPYVGLATTACTTIDSSNSNSILGYTCNGQTTSCQSYLHFRSQPPYNSVSSIASLLNSDPSQLSQSNNVSETETFDTNTDVIVPVNCSCSGPYYQLNTSYLVKQGDTVFLIANNTFQGLSTCQAIQNQSRNDLTVNLFVETSIVVPLRCACPTKNQTDVGIKYLLSYIITPGDDVSAISARFGVDTGRTLEANKLTEENDNIYPFTTLLLPFENQPSATQISTLPPPPPPPPPQIPTGGSSKKSSKTWVYILVAVIAGAAVLCVVGFIVFYRRKRRNRPHSDGVKGANSSESFEAYEKPMLKGSVDFMESLSIINADSLKVYKYEELQAATDDFNPRNQINGSSSVYRGRIKDDFAAIKKVSNNGDVSKEVNLLSKINHSNLIRLSGICFNDGDWYFVYDYAVNGSLSDWIYLSNKSENPKSLKWIKRIQIALDVANGLNYLHCFTNPPHVHQDIKARNVLLDSDFRAKISSFGLVRKAEGEEGQFALTRHIVGTKGYLAPEYLENGLISTKLDVYAFGVLLLEIFSGKEVKDLSDFLKNDQTGLSEFIDPSIEGDYPVEVVTPLLRLIRSSLNRNPTDRPSMHEVVQSLSKILSISQVWESSKDSSIDESVSYSF